MIDIHHVLSTCLEGDQCVRTSDLFSEKKQVDLPVYQICGFRLVHAVVFSKSWEVGFAYHVGREVVPRTVHMQRDIVSSQHRQLLSSPGIYILRIHVGLHNHALVQSIPGTK